MKGKCGTHTLRVARTVCVCVCVCEREREREKTEHKGAVILGCQFFRIEPTPNILGLGSL